MTVKQNAAAGSRRRREQGREQDGRALIATGSIGATIAAICCATPLLVVVLGAFGLTAWLAKADYVLIPTLIICLALVGAGLYRRRAAAQACCGLPASPQSEKFKS
jgi:mercuric ion transport protein